MELTKLVIVDTDFLSLYLKGDLLTKKYVEDMIVNGYLFTTTSITSSELFFGAYKKGWKRTRIEILKQFLDKIDVIAFNYKHSLRYGKLRATMIKKGIEIGFADTAIASICIEEAKPLFTFNKKHFKTIKQLELYNADF